MIGQLHHPRAWKAAFLTVLLVGLVLGACDHGSIPGADEAQAQPADQRRVRTFETVPETFDLFPDTNAAELTSITVNDGTTTYRINGDYTLQFTDNNGAQSINLEDGDLVIERPDLGRVTVFTKSGNF